MEEKVLIRSEKFSMTKILLTIIGVGTAISVFYGFISANRYSYEYAKLGYSSAFDMALKADGALKPMLALPIIISIMIAYIFYKAYSSDELVVTDKRVYGHTTFGKRVDLPIDSITAVGVGTLNSISVTTPSGAIKFAMIANNEKIHKTISEQMVKRQDVVKNVTTIKQEMPISDADELKKYKSLLEDGIITQEEFDAKKKQILDL